MGNKNNNQAFTLIELLLVITIIGILGAVIFIAVGNQRQKAKVNAALQTASSVVAIGHECYFTYKAISSPIAGNDVCSSVKAQWPEVTADGCDYNVGISDDDEYIVDCTAAGKRITCGVAQSNYGCKEEDIP